MAALPPEKCAKWLMSSDYIHNFPFCLIQLWIIVAFNRCKSHPLGDNLKTGGINKSLCHEMNGRNKTATKIHAITSVGPSGLLFNIYTALGCSLTVCLSFQNTCLKLAQPEISTSRWGDRDLAWSQVLHNFEQLLYKQADCMLPHH